MDLAKKAEIVDFGYDWLRLTWPIKSDELGEVRNVLLDYFEEAMERGENTKEKKLLQFTGIGTDKVKYVSSETHTMVDVSGSAANVIANKFVKKQITGKCTRLDTQITVDYHVREASFATRLRNRLAKSNVGDEKVARQNNAVFASCAGDTGLTIGHRSSTIYGRFYNAKDGGHKEYADGVWRAECEWKAERAVELWTAARNAASPDTLAAARTAGQFLAWGIDEPWMFHALPEKAPPIADVRSNDKTINWLHNQVMAACERLVREGRGEEVFRFASDVANLRLLIPSNSGRLESSKLIRDLRGEK